LNIIQVENDEYKADLRDLFSEYLEWVLLMCEKEFNVNLNVKELVKDAVNRSIEELNKYFPPKGRLFLCKYQTQIAGTASMRYIGNKIGEIKRMYVRPQYRGKGIGRSLLEILIKEVKNLEYSKLRLDSGPFMKEARALYHSVGFRDINPYPESEVFQEGIPEEIGQNWTFLEMTLI